MSSVLTRKVSVDWMSPLVLFSTIRLSWVPMFFVGTSRYCSWFTFWRTTRFSSFLFISLPLKFCNTALSIEGYLQPYQTSMMKDFWEKSHKQLMNNFWMWRQRLIFLHKFCYNLISPFTIIIFYLWKICRLFINYQTFY